MLFQQQRIKAPGGGIYASTQTGRPATDYQNVPDFVGRLTQNVYLLLSFHANLPSQLKLEPPPKPGTESYMLYQWFVSSMCARWERLGVAMHVSHQVFGGCQANQMPEIRRMISRSGCGKIPGIYAESSQCLNSPGLLPVQRRNARVKLLWSENPSR